jgi:hypothetical protein
MVALLAFPCLPPIYVNSQRLATSRAAIYQSLLAETFVRGTLTRSLRNSHAEVTILQ